MSRVGVAGSRICTSCLVVPGQDASGTMDGGILLCSETLVSDMCHV